MGGLLGGPKGMLAPLSNYWGACPVMICIFSDILLKKPLADGILEIFCSYSGTITSNSVL